MSPNNSKRRILDLVHNKKEIFYKCIVNAGFVKIISRYISLYLSRFQGYHCIESYRFITPYKHQLYHIRDKFDREYYENKTRMIVKYIDPKACVLEVGGGIGIFSCFINDRLQACNRHVVVERNKDMIYYLKSNRDLNNCAFHILSTVITSVKRSLALEIFARNYDIIQDGQPIMSIMSVEALQRRFMMKFNVLVMDLQGAEYDFAIENPSFSRNIDVAIIDFYPNNIASEMIRSVYDWLNAGGLRRVERSFCVECWARDGVI